jgi:hypothetical protein
MDLSIDFAKFTKKDLNTDFTPTRIWINFWERGSLSSSLLIDVLRIFVRFNHSEIVMMNLDSEARLYLTSLFKDYPLVKILER